MIPPVAELDAWLTHSENALGIDPAVRKTVIWSSRGEPTPLSFVYVHGFTATRQETAPLADLVAGDFNANLFYTRLTGHGLGCDDLRDVTLEQWLDDTKEAVNIGRRIGNQQILMASSTGATLIALLAIQGLLPDTVKAMVLLSPNYGPADRRAEFITLPAGLALARVLVGETRSFESINEAHQKYWTRESPVEALIPMMIGVKDLRRRFESQTISLPTLTVYCPDDQVVVPEFIEENMARYVHDLSRLHTVENPGDPSCHIVAGDVLAPDNTRPLATEITGFIRTVLDNRS